jgi:hypothetical protein
LPPYHDVAHDGFLAMKICQGLRPKSNYKIPQLIINIINQCWDADPLNRPKTDDLYRLLRDLYYGCDDIIYEQIKEADEINKRSSSIVQSTSSTSTLSYVTSSSSLHK